MLDWTSSYHLNYIKPGLRHWQPR